MKTETEEVLATYTLEMVGPKSAWRTAWAIDAAMKFPSWLRETEENLTDLLPEGYSVRIREAE